MSLEALFGNETLGIAFLIGSPFALLGFLLLLYGIFQSIRTANARASFRNVTGVIVRSDIRVVRASEGSGYYPDIEYEYQVDGQRYTGTRMTLGRPVGRGSPKAIEKVLAAYPPGQPVQVFYKPSQPKRSALELRNPATGFFVSAGLTLVILIVGALAVVTYVIQNGGIEAFTIGG